MIFKHIFGFKKKLCAVCGSPDVINAGKPIGYLCESHLLETYKAKFVAHRGRKIVIPPTTPDKYTAYVHETMASLRSYGLSEKDLAPISTFISTLKDQDCVVVQSQYDARDFLNIDFFESMKIKRETPARTAALIASKLSPYMNANGVDLPPDGDEDVIFYPLRA